MIYKVIAGDDIVVEVTVVDEVGNPIVISSLKDLKIIICAGECSGGYAEEWLLSAAEITVVDDANGIVSFIISKEFTEENEGFEFIVKVSVIIANPAFTNGEEISSAYVSGKIKIVEKC